MTIGQTAAPARTVCPGCRGAGYTSVPNDAGVLVSRQVQIPGDGELLCSVGTRHGGDATVTRPCPTCGDSDDPGWVPGFVAPM